MKKITRSLLGAAMSALAIPLALLVATGPAQAHFATVYHEQDFAAINDAHTSLSACDRENDEHYVYAEATSINGTTYRVYDMYDWECSRTPVSAVYQFRICEAAVGCTPWRAT